MIALSALGWRPQKRGSRTAVNAPGLQATFPATHAAAPPPTRTAPRSSPRVTLPAAEFPPRHIAEWYRLRWQIELAFKRMKSILNFGQLPKHAPASCRAWLHGKLLVALLVERLIVHAETLSPWGYPFDPAPESLAGDPVHAS